MKKCWLWRDLSRGDWLLFLVWFDHQIGDYQFGPGFNDEPAEQQVKRFVCKFARNGLLGRVGMD